MKASPAELGGLLFLLARLIAVDTNILIYAHREDSPFHHQAYRQIEALANSRAVWAAP